MRIRPYMWLVISDQRRMHIPAHLEISARNKFKRMYPGDEIVSIKRVYDKLMPDGSYPQGYRKP